MSNYNYITALMVLGSKAIKGVGPVFIRKNIQSQNYFSSNIAGEIFDLLEKHQKGVDLKTITFEIERANRIIEECENESINIIGIHDNGYPGTLAKIKDAPPLLFVFGNKNLFNQTTVGIIGTREPNKNGVLIAERISSHYQGLSWNICNGLAEGIDESAIKTNDKYYSQTIGVLAGGLNLHPGVTLPNKTATNAKEVLDVGGLLVSEYPPDFKQDVYSVIKSCRIQAGLSDGLVIIQSSVDGGSKFALTSFSELNRPLAVVSPLVEDEGLESYSANIKIRDESLEGLSTIIGLKRNKIYLKSIDILKSKADYNNFDLKIAQKQTDNNTDSDLF